MSARTPRFRSVLDSFTPYRPGRKPTAAGGRSFKLSSNESPYGPLPSVVGVIAAAASELNRYPDHGSAELSAADRGPVRRPGRARRGRLRVGRPDPAAADRRGRAGRRGALRLALVRGLSAAHRPGRGATSVRVPLRDQAHDLAAMAGAITGRTRLIFVCNPNNPTGTVVHADELTWFLDQVPEDCLVVLDEAYHEYIRDPGRAGRPHALPGPAQPGRAAHLLQGLRAGRAAGRVPDRRPSRWPPRCARPSSRSPSTRWPRPPPSPRWPPRPSCWSGSSTVLKERGRVRDELLGQGWTVPPTEANFVWLPLGPDTLDFAAASDQAGVAVRPYPPDGVRVSIGEPEAQRRVPRRGQGLAAQALGPDHPRLWPPGCLRTLSWGRPEQGKPTGGKVSVEGACDSREPGLVRAHRGRAGPGRGPA